MQIDSQDIVKNQDIPNNYQQNSETKVYDEIQLINFIDENYVKDYERFKKPKCCNTPKSLLIFSIIIVIFTCAGLYFSLSRNDGYKQYSQLLESNITLIKDQLPSEYENKKLVAYLTRDEFESNDDGSCSYIEYSLYLCEEENYTLFCNDQRYSENKCNYMDRQYFLKQSFTCDLTNYNNKKCNEIQYLDQLKKDENSNEDYKIEYVNSTIKIDSKEYYFEKIWCKIGNYDIPILFSFLIVMVLFIILLIFDLCINKATLIIGIKYYIVLGLYMIFYFIFRIYIILLLGLFIYSIIVSFNSPNTSGINDPFFFRQNEDNFDPITILWKNKRIYAFIYCGINLFLMIFVINLSLYKVLLYKYLSFDFEENDSNKIRKASIQIGKNNIDFEIIKDKNIYLKDRREKDKFHFKEIKYEDNIYYLKFNNIGLKDQLGWIEYNYPIINNGFEKLFLYMKILIYAYIFVIVILPIFHIKDDIFYNYFLYLFDLGYKPYLYDNLQKFADTQILLYNLVKYIFIVKAILVIISLFRWAFYGGFSNVAIIWVILFISVIITLICLFLGILSFLQIAYNIISTIIIARKIDFADKDFGFIKLLISNYLSAIQFTFIMILFGFSLTFSIFINSVRSEIKNLESEELDSEYAFKFKALNNENFIFEAVNLDFNLPKKLFYTKKIDANPVSNNDVQIMDQSTNLFLEQNQEDLLDQKNQLELKNFKNNCKNGLSENVLITILINLFSLVFIIIALLKLMKNDKYYQDYRAYVLEKSGLIIYNNTYFGVNTLIDENYGLPSFSKFWCDFGKVESDITTSYLVFIILHICFQIISYLIHKRIIKLDIKRGICYYLIIFFNSLFYVVFMIFFPFLFYLFFFFIFLSILSPFNVDLIILSTVIKDIKNNRYECLWVERKLIPAISIIFKFLILTFNCVFFSNIKTLILNYLNMNYIEKSKKKEKYEKNTSIIINNNAYNVKIISNEILYLKEMKLGTIYKFKQILIENITNGYVYVKLGHNSITDQISLSEWHYPDLNYIFSQIGTLCKFIYAILFISIPLFKCLIKEEFDYILYVYSNKIIKELGYKDNEPMFNNIFVYFGDFENGVIKSRFSLYIISMLFLLLFMLKRMLFGGFSSQIGSLISFIISLIFITLNSAFVILSFLIILFGIFALICHYEISFPMEDSILTTKLYLQLALNTIIFGINIKVLVESIKLSINLNDLRKKLVKFNNVEEIGEKDDLLNKNEFKYITLEGNTCHLKEVRSDKLQRYLYYSLDNNDQCNINSEVLNINKDRNIKEVDILQKDNLSPETEKRLNN